jgi:hypothetical protein
VKRRPLFQSLLLLLGLGALAAACPLWAANQRPPVDPASLLYTYDLDRLLADLEKSGASTLEEALPALPEALRSNFTLMRDARGLQESDPRRPRALLFTNDGKFVLSFTGDSSQRQGGKWEILQYVEGPAQRPAFELYDLSFPLKRGEGGKIVRPDKNPPKCLACHRHDPKPIWGRYEDWPGAFAEFYAQSTDPELGELRAFLASRAQHPRYRYLLPQAGSSISPFMSPDIKLDGTSPYFQFLPNWRLTNALDGLNSRKIADRLRLSPYYKDLLPLLVLELNIDINSAAGTGPQLRPRCGRPRDAGTNWHWTSEDVKKTEDAVRKVLFKLYDGALPYPDDAVLSDRNIIALFGVRFGDLFPMTSTSGEEPDPDHDEGDSQGSGNFLEDGVFHSGWIVSTQHYADLVKLHPELTLKVVVRTAGVESFFYDFLRHDSLTQDYDLPLARLWDSYGLKGSLDSGTDCTALYDLLRTGIQSVAARE